MSKIKKKNFIFVSLLLVIICGFVCCIPSYIDSRQTAQETNAIRTIEVKQNKMDYQSIFDEFENAKLETESGLTTFEGYQTLNLSDFEEFDLVSDTDFQEDLKMQVKYNFSFDAETGIVTLSAEAINSNGVVEIDEIQGIAFYNENGEIDAYLDVDGESVLLSEMRDAGMIANCGWFKKLWKKVVVAVVAVVVVSAVAAAVVATCGAGLGACIAAGAVAGGITGGVAGGVISYQETGEVQIWAVVGGLIGGAALGGLTGWAVGTIMGVGSRMTVGFGKGSFNSVDDCLDFHFKKHGIEVGAKNTDAYLKLASKTAQKVVKNGIPATRQVAGATANVFRYEVGNYYIHMAMNAKEIIIVSFGLLR
mgnify:CR=1 FL=1